MSAKEQDFVHWMEELGLDVQQYVTDALALLPGNGMPSLESIDAAARQASEGFMNDLTVYLCELLVE